MRNTIEDNFYLILQVISGNVVYFPRYLSKMNPEMQRTNLFVMAEFFLTEYNPDQFRTNERTVVSTALYLWHSMEFCDRFRIVQTHFKEFFRFILSFEGTEILIPAVKWYNPPVQSCRDNRRFLIQAAAGIPLIHKKSQKHRQIFHILYKKIGSMLNVIDVVHLLEVSVHTDV